eukprot:m.336350 g.336350  ORF g.336350 m.336350 type:complete len:70 (+) comp17822_c0_seq1:107-316(+)
MVQLTQLLRNAIPGRGYDPRALQSRNRRTTLLGVLVLGFTGAVYTYSLTSVKQEDFSDVVPAERATPSK